MIASEIARWKQVIGGRKNSANSDPGKTLKISPLPVLAPGGVPILAPRRR